MKVLLIILLILFLIGQIRVGIKAELCEKKVSLWVRVRKTYVKVLPTKGKPDKASMKSTVKTAENVETRQSDVAQESTHSQKEMEQNVPAEESFSALSDKLDMGLDYARRLLPIVLDLAKHFLHKLRIDTLCMILTVGNPDPADAAMLYGRANAALGALWYPLTNAFDVKDGSARVNLDFDATKTELYAQTALSLKIGQIVWIVLYFGLRCLRVFLSIRSQKKKMTETRKAA